MKTIPQHSTMIPARARGRGSSRTRRVAAVLSSCVLHDVLVDKDRPGSPPRGVSSDDARAVVRAVGRGDVAGAVTFCVSIMDTVHYI